MISKDAHPTPPADDSTTSASVAAEPEANSPSAPPETTEEHAGPAPLAIYGATMAFALWQSLRRTRIHDGAIGPLFAPPPPDEPSPPRPEVPAQPWGVTEKPKKITWEFCFKLKWRTWPEVQKQVVPSPSSRSQYLRVATLPEIWGKRLDERGTQFQVLRWIAAPDDFSERQDRYMRVLASERPGDLVRREKHATPTEPAYRPTEEQLLDVEAFLLEKTGQIVRLPRENDRVAGVPEPSPALSEKKSRRRSGKQAGKKRGRPPRKNGRRQRRGG